MLRCRHDVEAAEIAPRVLDLYDKDGYPRPPLELYCRRDRVAAATYCHRHPVAALGSSLNSLAVRTCAMYDRLYDRLRRSPIVQLIAYLYRESKVPRSILAGATSDICEDLWSSRTRYLRSRKILFHTAGRSTYA
jgi:hypothetical protein